MCTLYCIGSHFWTNWRKHPEWLLRPGALQWVNFCDRHESMQTIILVMLRHFYNTLQIQASWLKKNWWHLHACSNGNGHLWTLIWNIYRSKKSFERMKIHGHHIADSKPVQLSKILWVGILSQPRLRPCSKSGVIEMILMTHYSLWVLQQLFPFTELIFLLPRTPVKQKERYPEELLFLPQIARNRLGDSTKSVFRK